MPRLFKRAALIMGLLSILALLFLGQQAKPHGLTRTFIGSDGYQRVGLWAWPYVDGADFEAVDWNNHVHTIQFKGTLWQGAAGQTTWRIVHNGGVTVRVDGQLVFQQTDQVPLTFTDIPVTWTTPSLDLDIEYSHDIQDPALQTVNGPRMEFAIYEPGIAGQWRLLPTERLYPQAPDPAIAQAEIRLAQLSDVALIAVLLAILSWIILTLYQLKIWRSQTAWLLTGLIILAFAVRAIVLANRMAVDPLFYWLQPGGDDNYLVMARQMLSGEYHLAGTFWQPGNIIWFGVLIKLFGPQIWKPYLANIIVGAFSVSAIAGAGWIAFGKRAGLAAGLIAALYGPLIFYHGTLQTASMDASLMAFAALFGLWAVERNSIRAAALFGITIGLAALFRPNTMLVIGALIMAPLVAFVLAKRPVKSALSDPALRQNLKLAGVSVLFLVITIGPQVIANWSVGKYYPFLINGNGSLTIYSGNDRDSDGTWINRGDAFTAALDQNADWTAVLLTDVKADPLRVAELMLRKMGLFWENHEAMSNVNYDQQGLIDAPLLNALSLNGLLGIAILGGLAWFGLWLGLLNPRQNPVTVWLLIWMILIIVSSTVIVIVASRIRAPVLPLLCVGAGLGVDAIITAISKRRVSRPLVYGAALSLAFSVAMPILQNTFPAKSFFNGNLPADSVPSVQDFDSTVRLLGFSPMVSDHKPGGYAYVTLYWQLLKPVTEDYSVFVEFTDQEQQRLASVDRPLGFTSYPYVVTSGWPVGATLAESYLIQLPKSLPSVTNIHVGLYRKDTLERLPLTDAQGYAISNFMRLSAFGVITPDMPTSLPTLAQPIDAQLGDSLHVISAETSLDQHSLQVQVQLSTDKPVPQDAVLFFHLVDSSQVLKAQSDSPTLVGNWTTSALIPGIPIQMTRTFDLPNDLPDGDYDLVMGAYLYPSIQRFPAWDSHHQRLPNDLIDLGTVHVGIEVKR